MTSTSAPQDVVVYVRPWHDGDQPDERAYHLNQYLREMQQELHSASGYRLRAVFIELDTGSYQARADLIRFLQANPEIKRMRVSNNWDSADDDALAPVGRYVRLHTTTGSWVPEPLKETS